MAQWEKVSRPNKLSLRIPVEARSAQQKAACEAVCKRGSARHVVIEAVAGSGKTESLTHILHDYSRAFPAHSVLFLAFGSDIKKALEGRIPVNLADVKTCHGCGYGSANRTSPVPLARMPYSIVKHPKWGDGKASNLAIEAIDGDHLIAFFKARLPGKEESKKADIASLCKLLSLGKTCLAGLVPVYNLESGELLEVKRDRQSLIDTANRFGLEFDNVSIQDAADHVLAAMDWTKEGPGITFQKKRGRWSRGEIPTEEKRTITFDDQMWLPIINGWAFPRYDLVLVDESQDLSPARRLIVVLSLKPGGKIVAVGDRYQSIFGFAGAETDALPNLIKQLEAEVLPLSVTYRCAQNIVREARQVDCNIMIEARDNAPEGIVDTIPAEKLIEEVSVGDAIISRTNAPLVKIFFTLAKQGIRCVMLGKDYAGMLAYRIKGWRTAHKREIGTFTGTDMIVRNRLWYAERVEKLGEGKASQKERAQDEMMTIEALTTELPVPLDSEQAVEEVLSRLYKMFSKDGAAKGAKDSVVLASTHKFKGDERDRVFLLIETYKPGESRSGRDGEAQEETNLLYVGITRAKEHLTYVTGALKSPPSSEGFGATDLDAESEALEIESGQL